jgi:hypothetical protein
MTSFKRSAACAYCGALVHRSDIFLHQAPRYLALLLPFQSYLAHLEADSQIFGKIWCKISDGEVSS